MSGSASIYETGLDYFESRYFSAAQGRFTSPDEPLIYQNPANPQSWNLYSYVRNNPLRFVDAFGRKCVNLDGGGIGDDGTDPVYDDLSIRVSGFSFDFDFRFQGFQISGDFRISGTAYETPQKLVV